MKTALSWLEQIDLQGLNGTVERQIETLKAIQLDAWKQGMTDAAGIVDASRSGSVMDTRIAIEDIHLKRDGAKSV